MTVVPKVVYNTLPMMGRWQTPLTPSDELIYVPSCQMLLKCPLLQIISQTMAASVWESQWHGLRLGKHEDREGIVTLPTPTVTFQQCLLSALQHYHTEWRNFQSALDASPQQHKTTPRNTIDIICKNDHQLHEQWIFHTYFQCNWIITFWRLSSEFQLQRPLPTFCWLQLSDKT
jgi:hypothetical protein